MNLIAIDIGNQNIKIALYVKDEEKLLKTADENAGDIESQLTDILTECWDQVPLVEGAKEPVKDGVIVASSVKPDWRGQFGQTGLDGEDTGGH
jgi:pantothenate kinase type III